MTYKQNNLSKKYKTVLVWQADYPWDIRISKQLNTLVKNNLEAHIICRNCKNLPHYENYGLLHIWRFKNVIQNQKLQNIINFPFHINPLWNMHIENVVKKVKPDVLMVRDLPLATSTINIGKKFKIPVIADIAEHYPALIRELPYRYGKNFISKFLLYKMNWYDNIERTVVDKSDFIFTVAEEQKKRLVKDYNVNPNKIEVVYNSPTEQIKNFDYRASLRNKLKIIYVGKIEAKFRGIDTLIDAAEMLKAHNLKFTIIGYGDEQDAVKNKIESLNLQNVDFLGYKNQNEIQEYLRVHDIGIIPHLKSDVTDYTLPNKLFDYMAAKIPVISSNIIPVERIIREENCGWVYKAGNASELSDLIVKISQNKADLKQTGENGWNAVKNKYNWYIDGEKMRKIIKNIIEENK